MVVSRREQAIITGLLQSAGQSAKDSDVVLDRVQAAMAGFASADDRLVVHGKDACRILTKQLSSLEIEVDDSARLLFSSFDRRLLHEFPALAAVTEYLAGA